MAFAFAITTITACQPNENLKDNGLTAETVDASFTITPAAGTNRYKLDAVTTGVIGSKWDLGDGAGEYVGKTSEIIFLPDADTYTITHTAIGKGGITSTATKVINVAVSDPISGNLVRGGKFKNTADHNQWTRLNIGSPGPTSWVFNTGSATIFGNSWNQQGIYQQINVIGGKRYKIDLVVSGGGSVNTWFEVYANVAAPVQGVDYTAGGRLMGLSTWDGCANSAFSGKLSNVGCVGSGGEIVFPQSGPIYFLIKSGGQNLGASGIKMTNVEMRGI